MLSINGLRVGTIFLFRNQPYQIIEAKHIFMGRGSSTLQVKIKNLITGNLLSESFKSSDSFEEAEITRKEIKYLYNHRGEFWFCEKDDPSKRFLLKEKIIGEQVKFLKSNSTVKAIQFQEEIVGIELPIKIDIKVKQAPPGERKDAAQRSSKLVILENDTQIKAPLFINSGDIIRINTKTGEYVERVKKA
jgi:elongation factor P